MSTLRVREVCVCAWRGRNVVLALFCNFQSWNVIEVKELRMRWLLRGNKETVQNMPDAIFGLAAIRSSQILARMKVCVLLFTRSLQPQPQPPTLHRLLYQAKGSVWPAAQTSALLCRFSTGIVMMRSVGRSLTEIESVARQIWTSLGASGGCYWPFSPSPASLDLIRSLLWPSGPFKGLTSHQPGLLMEPFLHFMDAWSLISIKIIRFYLVLYIAQTVPTHPESFQTDRFRNRRYVKWIGNALPYENLNPDILFYSYWSSFFDSLIWGSRSIHLSILHTSLCYVTSYPFTLPSIRGKLRTPIHDIDDGDLTERDRHSLH